MDAPGAEDAADADEAAGTAGTAGTTAEAVEPVVASEEKSDAKAELEAGSVPEPTLRLTKVAAPAPGAEPEAGAKPESTPAVEPDPTPEPAPEAESEPAPAPEPVADRSAGRRRLKAALWPPRLSRGQLVV
ncbi:hypothetical protein ACFU6K_29965, partial [Kitasatospora sp. NPDC057512]